MQNEIFENWTKMNLQVLDSIKKLGETNLKLGEKLLQEQVELTTTLFDTATGGAEQLGKSKDYSDIAAKQAEMLQECSRQLVGSARSCADILTEAGKVYNQMFEQGVKACGEPCGKASGKRKAA